MEYPTRHSKDNQKKMSRSKFLRESATAITAVSLISPAITGCLKGHFQPTPPSCKSCEDLEPGDLEKAAANLTRMREWITDLYPFCIEYEEIVFHALGSTKENGNWVNFIVDVFIDIAIGIAATTAALTGGAAAIPALAALSAFLHDWGIGKDKPDELQAVFAEFEIGHNKMQFAIEQKLSSMADPTNNYSNLLAAWNEEFEFNGQKYTISQLANSNFPGLGDDYNALQKSAYTYFQKSLWNLAIMKCCTYYENYHQYPQTPQTPAAQFYLYVQKTFYPKNKGVYVRGSMYSYNDEGTITWELIYYNLGIGGYALPDDASNILFMDDTPGHIINPDGLFNRSYVFQQFHTTKPEFKAHELAEYPNDVGNNFAYTDDWDYTGGLFPVLADI